MYAWSKFGATSFGHLLNVGERLRAVDVPGDLVEDRLEHVDRDEAHAGLDQPAGQQAALAEAGPAVAVADRVRFLLEGERLAGLRDSTSAGRRA